MEEGLRWSYFFPALKLIGRSGDWDSLGGLMVGVLLRELTGSRVSGSSGFS